MNEQLKIQKRVLSLDVYGDKYELKMPTSKMKNDFKVGLMALSVDPEASDYNFSINYLVELGLPLEVCHEIEEEDMLEIFNTLHSKKKK